MTAPPPVRLTPPIITPARVATPLPTFAGWLLLVGLVLQAQYEWNRSDEDAIEWYDWLGDAGRTIRRKAALGGSRDCCEIVRKTGERLSETFAMRIQKRRFQSTGTKRARRMKMSRRN